MPQIGQRIKKAIMDNIIDDIRPDAPINLNDYPSPLTVLAFTLLAVLLLTLLASGIMLAYLTSQGIALDEITDSLTANSTASDRNLVRNTLLINHLGTFVLPGVLTMFFLYKSKWLKALNLNIGVSASNIVLGTLMTLASFPLIQYSFYLNKQLPLPDWMVSIEDSTAELITNLLITTESYELFFNIFVIAVIPAIGEEIIFRGILQKQVQRLTHNPHVAIWFAAIVFSAIHVQFQGFFPRMILGALLGYLLYWSGSLWLPIIAHFFNNAIQVIAQYMYSEEMSNIDLEAIDSVPWWSALMSLILVVGLGYTIWNNNNRTNDEGSHFA